MSGSAPTPISGVVVCFNEEADIARCLESLSFCDEILVVDSHSTDATPEIARGLATRVIQREWPGYVKQKTFAMESAAHDWVVSLDADEWLEPALAAEIERRVRGDGGRYKGYELDRVTDFLGQRFDRGAWYPDWCLRVYDRRVARIEGRDPHDHVYVDGDVARLSGTLHHNNYRDLSDHVQTVDRFSTISARELYDAGRRARWSDLVLRPWGRFLKGYLLKQGFRKGWPGFHVELTGAYFVFLKYMKLWEIERDERRKRAA